MPFPSQSSHRLSRTDIPVQVIVRSRFRSPMQRGEVKIAWPGIIFPVLASPTDRRTHGTTLEWHGEEGEGDRAGSDESVARPPGNNTWFCGAVSHVVRVGVRGGYGKVYRKEGRKAGRSVSRGSVGEGMSERAAGC